MKEIRNYNIRSIIIAGLGVLMILWVMIEQYIDVPKIDDDVFVPLGISMILFGLARFFFRTPMQSVGRKIFGVWLIVAGMYCFIRGIVFMPGLFGFVGAFILVIVGAIMWIVDF
ncbi:MAG: hypothetical protein IJ796_06755 [Lachnospiraceae bacterium]|nr:hypothetical protein [Lachnospiraceae bacterium]